MARVEVSESEPRLRLAPAYGAATVRPYLIRSVHPFDAERLAKIMRNEDTEEVLASHGLLARQAIDQSLRNSSAAFALELNGEFSGLFGVCPGGVGYDVPWLLTGKSVAKHPIAFWKASKRALSALLEVHPVLVNMIDARYAAAIRWAERTGAKVREAQPWGASGLPFHLVIWRSPWAQGS